MNDGWVLAVFPRSSLGFKYRLQLNNTVGIIDSDYFFSDNEGHIFVKLTNDTKEDKTVELAEGAGFAQGIFLPFGITEDDDCTEARNGGFGIVPAAAEAFRARQAQSCSSFFHHSGPWFYAPSQRVCSKKVFRQIQHVAHTLQ